MTYHGKKKVAVPALAKLLYFLCGAARSMPPKEINVSMTPIESEAEW